MSAPHANGSGENFSKCKCWPLTGADFEGRLSPKRNLFVCCLLGLSCALAVYD